MIKTQGDFIELAVMIEKYKKVREILKDQDGRAILKTNGKPEKHYVSEVSGFFILPTNFMKEGITLYGQVYNERNKVLKTRSSVFDKYTNKFYLVKHEYQELQEALIEKDRQHLGFQVKK